MPLEPQWDKHSIHETKTAVQWIVENIFTQSAHAPDAATRRQDHGDFAGWFPLKRIPDLAVRRG
jgi:hypothetical protein